MPETSGVDFTCMTKIATNPLGWQSQWTMMRFSLYERLWSDWADAQADLSLRWAHFPFCWFCHEVAHLVFTSKKVNILYFLFITNIAIKFIFGQNAHEYLGSSPSYSGCHYMYAPHHTTLGKMQYRTNGNYRTLPSVFPFVFHEQNLISYYRWKLNTYFF